MRIITRRHALAGISAGAAVFANRPLLAASAKKQYDLNPIKVADGIWMIEGTTDYFSDENGGAIVNCVLIETTAGLIIVDTGPSLRYGVALREVASQLGVLGIAAIINTHHHPDHFFGNQVFKERPIYALDGTKKLAEAEGEGFADSMYRLLGDWMRGTESTPPTKTFTTSSIKIGNREFTIYPLEGHTGADLALLDNKTGTLITGDLSFLDRAPTTPHADIKKWQASIVDLQGIEASGIIPGHGRFDTSGQSLKQTSDYLTWLDDTLRRSAVEGLDMVEILDTNIPPQFEKIGAMPEEFYRSIAHLFPDIERDIMPLTNR